MALKLPDSYTYKQVRCSEDEEVYRVKEITDKSSAEIWIDKLCTESHITWRVLKTYPRAGVRNVYRKDFRCQHFTDRRASSQGPSKNTNCPARLEVIVKRSVKYSRSKTADPLLPEYPSIVTFKKKHNHPIHCADSLKHRDMSVDTKEKLCSLFRCGHNPSSALHSLKMDLMIEHGDDYYKVAADGHYLPSLSIATKLFKSEFANEYGNFEGDKMFDKLEEMLSENNKYTGGKATFKRSVDGEHYFVVLCTPIMLRAHKVAQSKELVLLDAAGGMDKQRHRVYVFVTPTAAGGLPLGVIITDCESEKVFTEALECFKNLTGDTAFYSQKYPAVFLTDNDMKERNALRNVFPKSTLQLCQFHMLKAMWSWLSNKSHSIKAEHRQELYFLFKSIVYSFSAENAVNNFFNFSNRCQILGYENLTKHSLWLWQSKEDWVSYYRKNLPMRGNNTTNYVEIVFRILKDVIFDRILAYNLNQLVDFLLHRYENYMRQRLIDFANGRYTKSLLLKMLPKYFDKKSTAIEQEEEGCFKVIIGKETHHVDLMRGVCTCYFGMSGSLCIHSSAVFVNLDESSVTYNIADDQSRQLMLYVAEGTTPSSDWFKPLKMDCTKSNKYASESEKCITSMEKSYDYQELASNSSPVLNTLDSSAATSNFNEIDDSNFKESPALTENVSDTEMKKFDSFVTRIKNGLQSNPSIFVPAFKKMMKNISLVAGTDNGLVTAMHTFGLYTGVQSCSQKAAKKILRRSHRTFIGVQPTAVARRKSLLSGRRKQSVGRPSRSVIMPKLLNEHDYTSFSALPSKKRKMPHNLEKCVYANKSLGK